MTPEPVIVQPPIVPVVPPPAEPTPTVEVVSYPRPTPQPTKLLALTGDGNDLLIVAALMGIGLGLVAMGTSYRRRAAHRS